MAILGQSAKINVRQSVVCCLIAKLNVRQMYHLYGMTSTDVLAIHLMIKAILLVLQVYHVGSKVFKEVWLTLTH